MKYTFAAAALAASFATGASALTYQYTSTNTNGVDSVYVYNEDTEIFKLDFAVDATRGVDGAWWVVNDGPMPQHGTRGKYAIFYTDMTDVWAYQYEGGFSRPGNNTGPLLEKWEGAVSSIVDAGKETFSLTLDVGDLKALPGLDPHWVGIGFDDMIGTWLHPTIGTFAGAPDGTYVDANGGLSFFNGRKWIGWDEANRTTTVVPLPASVAFLLAGLAGLGVAGRRKKA